MVCKGFSDLDKTVDWSGTKVQKMVVTRAKSNCKRRLSDDFGQDGSGGLDFFDNDCLYE